MDGCEDPTEDGRFDEAFLNGGNAYIVEGIVSFFHKYSYLC